MKIKTILLSAFIVMLCISCKDVYQAREFDVTIADVSNGNIIVEGNTFRAGQVVRVNIIPDTLFKMKDATLVYTYGKRSVLIEGNKFIMPSAPIVISAKFIGTQEYTLTMDKGENAAFIQSMVLNAVITASEALDTSAINLAWTSSNPAISVTQTSPISLTDTNTYTVTAKVASATVGAAGKITIATSDGEYSAWCDVVSLANIFTTTEDSGKRTITGFTKMATPSSTITIPAEIDSQPVVAIGASAFKNADQKENITTIFLPPTLTSIEDRAFEGLNAITTIISYAATPPTLEGTKKPFETDSLQSIKVSDKHLSVYMFDTTWQPNYKKYIIGLEDHRIFLDSVNDGTFSVKPRGGTDVNGAKAQTLMDVTTDPNPSFQYKVDSVKLYTVDEKAKPASTPYHIIKGPNPAFLMPDYPIFISLEFENIPAGITITEEGEAKAERIVISTTGDDTIFNIYITPKKGYKITTTSAPGGATFGTDGTTTIDGSLLYKLEFASPPVTSTKVAITWIAKSYTVKVEQNKESWLTKPIDITITNVQFGKPMPDSSDLTTALITQGKPASSLLGIFDKDSDKKYYSVPGGRLVSNAAWDKDETDVVLEARWLGEEKTVKLLDSLDITSELGTLTVKYDNDMPEKVPPPQKGGYAFTGYYIQQLGGTNKYYDNLGNITKVNTSSTSVKWGYYHQTAGAADNADRMDPTNLVLYAQWESTKWDGSTISKPTSKDGWYEISAPEEFAWLAAATTEAAQAAKYRVLRDLDFGEKPLAMVSSFSGTFDGGGYKFSGVRIRSAATQVGLFGEVKGTGIVRNIVLGDASSSIIGEGTYTGSIAGLLSSGGTIENCQNYAPITSTSAEGTGGIVGTVTDNGILSNVANYGAVTGEATVGGIVGFYNGNKEISSLYNAGAINTTSLNPSKVGGLIGRLGSPNATLKKVANIGTIMVATSATKVGGLIGHIDGSSPTINIQEFYNTAAVFGSSNIGGAVGEVVEKTLLQFDNGYIVGKVSSSGSGSGSDISAILVYYTAERIAVSCSAVFYRKAAGGTETLVGNTLTTLSGVDNFATAISPSGTALWSGHNYDASTPPTEFNKEIWKIGESRTSISNGIVENNTRRPVIKGLGQDGL